MRQIASSILALLMTLAAFGAAASPAFATTVQYRAEPATAQSAARFVVNEIVWKCGPAGCVGVRGHSRPATDCAALAREIGELRSFSVAGRPISADELEKCNARAR
jgi:hypothetical protein